MGHRLVALLVAALLGPGVCFAQGKEEDLAKQLANPVASLISVPLQNNFDFGIGPDEPTAPPTSSGGFRAWLGRVLTAIRGAPPPPPAAPPPTTDRGTLLAERRTQLAITPALVAAVLQYWQARRRLRSSS